VVFWNDNYKVDYRFFSVAILNQAKPKRALMSQATPSTVNEIPVEYTNTHLATDRVS
jgi:hypothetical protein